MSSARRRRGRSSTSAPDFRASARCAAALPGPKRGAKGSPAATESALVPAPPRSGATTAGAAAAASASTSSGAANGRSTGRITSLSAPPPRANAQAWSSAAFNPPPGSRIGRAPAARAAARTAGSGLMKIVAPGPGKRAVRRKAWASRAAFNAFRPAASSAPASRVLPPASDRIGTMAETFIAPAAPARRRSRAPSGRAPGARRGPSSPCPRPRPRGRRRAASRPLRRPPGR